LGWDTEAAFLHALDYFLSFVSPFVFLSVRFCHFESLQFICCKRYTPRVITVKQNDTYIATTDVQMTLKEWLAKKKWSHADMATALCVDRSQVWRWCRGENIPHRDTISDIAEITGNKVQASDFY
tara:strand:+ start:3402 stop:3776 length:375 start_codon:yes stop_codon:yes gene_type:complete